MIYPALVIEALTQQLEGRQDLAADAVGEAVRELINDAVALDAKVRFLTALALKGETTEEIGAFAAALRDLSIQPPLDPLLRQGPLIDVCGTGGDYLGTFNISTTVALIVASAGVAVAKHGNRAITSKTGSADVVETLGIPIDSTPAEAAKSLAEHHFAFFFAPHYHPAFKHIAPVRRRCAEMGQRTIFNIIGPLLNPARPNAQIIGVPTPTLCEPMARVLQTLGVRRGMVVSGSIRDRAGAYQDEFSTLGSTKVAEFYQEHGFSVSDMSPDAFPVQPATLADLSGGDREANAEIIRQILRGEDRGPRRDAVLLNTGAALFVAGKTRSLIDGWERAAELIDSGQAMAKLNELRRA